MRTVVISGGPSPRDICIVDSESGQDITSLFLSFKVEADAQKLAKVTLTAWVELKDLVAETSIIDAEIVVQ